MSLLEAVTAAYADNRATGASIPDALARLAEDERDPRRRVLVANRALELAELADDDLATRAADQGFRGLVSRDLIIRQLALHEVRNEECARMLLEGEGLP